MMALFMKRFSMALSVLIIPVSGLIIFRGHQFEMRIIMLIALMLIWALLELAIGLTKPACGKPASDRVIKLCRMLWPLFVVYSWVDYGYGWTKINIPVWAADAFLFLCLTGLVIRLWAIVRLGRSFTYDIKKPDGDALVRTGPYRFLRHPAYLGVCILGSFPALVLGSVIGFAGLTVTTFIHTVRRIRVEERMLEAEFGEGFREYKRKTNALVPFIY